MTGFSWNGKPLPPGTYIRFRYKGDWNYGRIEDEDTYTLMILEKVPTDTVIHQGVWKGDRFETRRVLRRRDI